LLFSFLYSGIPLESLGEHSINLFYMSPNKPLIFIVEDDPLCQEMIKNELQTNGYDKVIVFGNGEECLGNLFKMPKIIMLDYHLEGSINGIQVLKEIKSINPDIQVIMLSAQEKLEVAINSMKYGAYDYIVKNDVAMKRIKQMVDKIVKWNELLFENAQFKKNRNRVLAAVGVLIVMAVVLKIMIPLFTN
jgi:two-component system, OmpR family, response regulator